MDTMTIIGTIGALIILIFFFLNQTHKVSRDSLLYDGANFVGAILLLIYSILLPSTPFAALNLVWALVSLRDIFVDLKRR